MPKSFLVKKSEPPSTSACRSLQDWSSPKRQNSSEDYGDKWREMCSFTDSPDVMETKWEPLDTSEYETGIENAHNLARELHLPWLRGLKNVATPSSQKITSETPELLSHPMESNPELLSHPMESNPELLSHPMESNPELLSHPMESNPYADIRAVSFDKTFPFDVDVEAKPKAVPLVKGIFHTNESDFHGFVRSPNDGESLFFSAQETRGLGASHGHKPQLRLLSSEANVVATARRPPPPLLHNPVSTPDVLKTNLYGSNYSETKTAAELSPKKSRTTDSESSEADDAPAKFTDDRSKEEMRPFKCDHCIMSFTRSSDLQRHLLIHNNNKPYKCEECDREFTWFGNFQKHILTHINVGNPAAGSTAFSNMFTLLAGDQAKDLFVKVGDKYSCRLCSKDFTRLSGLKTHIRMHTGERPFVCQVCGFAFTTSRSLKMHMRLHTGEKPYKCEVCDRAFTRRDELFTHVYIHKGEKPFKCDKCPASFIRYGHLQRHMLIHSDDKPYKCKICPKSFTQYRNLQTHVYKHTGERPHRCRFCPKGFTQYGTLQAHERTHTGEKPFKCHLCEKAFITSSHLRWHTKTQHGQG